MLTDAQIRKAKADSKSKKLADGEGLFLFITTAGSKLWRLKYRFNGAEKLLSIGPYPSVSLAEARQAKDDAKALLRAGKDPSIAKKLQKLAGEKRSAETFETIAREWHALQKSQWVEKHAQDVLDSFEKEVFPHIGNSPIRELDVPEVMGVLRLIENRQAHETAHRVRQRISAVFVYAIASGRAAADPAAVVKGALAPITKGRQPAITTLAEVKEMIRKVESEPAHPVTKLAHRLLALTALRPGTLIGTSWLELNGIVDDVWQVPAARMKLKRKHKEEIARDHLVPLSVQARDVIEALRTVTGRGPLAFPNTRHSHKPMSENAIGYLLNRAGYHQKHVPHGWRSSFSTVMNERDPADKDMIDLMLAHVPKDKVEGAYNRALHLARRKELAQIWADILMEGMPPAASLLEGPRR